MLHLGPVRRIIASATMMLLCCLLPGDTATSWHPDNEQSHMESIKALPAATTPDSLHITVPRVVPNRPSNIRFFPQRSRLARNLLASERLPVSYRPRWVLRDNFRA